MDTHIFLIVLALAFFITVIALVAMVLGQTNLAKIAIAGLSRLNPTRIQQKKFEKFPYDKEREAIKVYQATEVKRPEEKSEGKERKKLG